MLKKSSLLAALAALFIGTAAAQVSAQPLAPQQRLCDPTFEDCRADILTYIQQETVGIDMAFWMMTDARYSNALVAAAQRGVRIRLLMDTRCADAHEKCQPQNDQMSAAGLPMRKRITSGILHWKMIFFAGQGQVEFAGANYAPFELTPDVPWVNFTDEIVFFSNDPSILQSFMRKFDDMWVSTTEFADYANITGPLQRLYPMYPIDPRLNFPPDDSYRARSTQAYAQEQQGMDVLMFRITDERQTDAVLAAHSRGVEVRLITDETEYRNTSRLWHSYNVDKMYNAGVQVRVEDHQGINHEKAVLLRGLGMSIFGSSNWTSPSSDSQREHNMFTTDAWIFDWLENQFTRKWTNGHGTSETKAFVPLPPDAPVYNFPASSATGVPTSGVSLSWYAGLWAHNYDIYFGTTPNPPLLESNRRLGPSQYSTDYRYYTLPALQPGTRYYWKVVSKTMAFLSADGPVWSFQTAGTAPAGLPSGWTDADVGATGATGGASFSGGAFTVTGAGADVWGTADQFHFAYRTLDGDGSIVARVASIENVNAWTKAGVMMRNSLSPSASQGFMLVAASAAKGTPFQRRTADGGASVSTPGAFVTAPYWVKLVRTGNQIAAYESANGTSWTLVGTDTFTMGSTILVGLAVSSHVTGTNATATFDNVTVTTASPPPNTPPTVAISAPATGATFTAPASIAITASAGDSDGTVSKVDFYAGSTLLGTDTSAPYQFTWNNVSAGAYTLTAVATDNGSATTTSSAVSIAVNAPAGGLPAGWSNTDVGDTGAAGNASYSGGTFTITGAGADVWGTADALQFAYRQVSGDFTIVARVASIQAVHAWTKAGVMVRGSVSASSAQAFMLVASSSSKGVPFQRRRSDGDISYSTPGSQSTAPRWVKLVRAGDTITGYESADGVTWTMVGSDTLVMGTNVLVGLGVSSHIAGTNATATFDNVTIQ